VSVVVPVYNVAEYLPGCLDALLAQQDVSLEIIAVDDGSSDNSGQILDDYAAKHPIVQVLHTSNQGLGAARANGLAKAQGEYIGFIDSDDVPAPNMYATMLRRAVYDQADIVVCGFERFDFGSDSRLSQEMLGFGDSSHLVSDDPGILLSVNPAAWNKLYRASLFNDAVTGFCYPRFAEDLILQLLLMPKVEKISFVAESLYRYRVRAGSITDGIRAAAVEDFLESLLAARRLIATSTDSPRLDEMLTVYDNLAFLHYGLSTAVRLKLDAQSLSEVLKQSRTVLDREFPLYKNGRFHSLAYLQTHQGRNLPHLLAAWAYRLHLTWAVVRLLRMQVHRRSFSPW
jgi:glycosyltransferase EpsH